MRVIIAGVPQEMADEYAMRLLEQGRAVPAPPAVAKSESSIRPKPKGKRKDVSENEPKDPD